MKTSVSLILAAALFLPFTMQGRSAKRGVSENEFQYKAQLAALDPGVCWYYNWGNTPGRYIQDEEMEFIPMCWNANYNADAIREYVSTHPGCRYLLGFNEPNFTKQANMTPAAAAAEWPKVKALADELGLQLVAPALNYSPNPPYQDPTKWMDEFIELVGEDAFDFMAVHSYGGFDVTKQICTTFHERYGKPVWLTEFCLWPNEGDPNSTVSQESQTAAMMSMVEWLEKSDFIYRYAWFKAIGNSNAPKGPNYGLLLSGKGEEPRELSQQGLVYVYMPDFDSETANEINTVISSASYSSQSGCVMNASNDSANPLPIEISRFNGGAWAEYRFQIPQAGVYRLTLNVSGVGEPTRFDPTIGIYAVNEDGSQGTELAAPVKFTLSGSDDQYRQQWFDIELPAGKQTIRIADTNPYGPSGIHISTLRLADATSVASLTMNNEGRMDIFNSLGIKVGETLPDGSIPGELPDGLYIIGGEKHLMRR
ncbi:MAG: hypothetical protein HDS26_04145 [Bacteroides sp.]|nr:hypothetical protein [Bacteroides sp.]